MSYRLQTTDYRLHRTDYRESTVVVMTVFHSAAFVCESVAMDEAERRLRIPTATQRSSGEEKVKSLL